MILYENKIITNCQEAECTEAFQTQVIIIIIMFKKQKKQWER